MFSYSQNVFLFLAVLMVVLYITHRTMFLQGEIKVSVGVIYTAQVPITKLPKANIYWLTNYSNLIYVGTVNTLNQNV